MTGRPGAIKAKTRKQTSENNTQLLRVQVTNPASPPVVFYSPNMSGSFTGYDFIVEFGSAQLSDVNDRPLGTGEVTVGIASSAVTQFDLAILGPLLQTFQGFYSLDVQGSYDITILTTQPSLISVFADSIAASNIQPAQRKEKERAKSPRVKVGRASQLLRVSVTNPVISQMLYQPNNSTYPSYDFAFNFTNATLADANGNPLGSGFMNIDAKPGAFSQFDLAILARLLQPFQGSYTLDLQGTYTLPTTASPLITVLADSLSGSLLQPGNFAGSKNRLLKGFSNKTVL